MTVYIIFMCCSPRLYSTCIFSIKSGNDPIHPQLQIFMENGAKTQISLKFTDRDKIEFYFTGKSLFYALTLLMIFELRSKRLLLSFLFFLLIQMPTLTVSATIKKTKQNKKRSVTVLIQTVLFNKSAQKSYNSLASWYLAQRMHLLFNK